MVKTKTKSVQAKSEHASSSLADSQAVDANEASYTWDALLRRVGPASQEELTTFGVAVSPPELVAMGRRIRSEKLRTDLLRWCGTIIDFWEKAPSQHRVMLRGFSESYLRVLIHEGKKLDGLIESRKRQQSSVQATRAADHAELGQAVSEGRRELDSLYAAFVPAVRHDAKLSVEIAAAYTRANDANALSEALQALATFGKMLLSKKGSPIALRLHHSNVTVEALDELEQLAKKVSEGNGKTSGARPTQGVSQSDLDHQDGVCLVHMQDMMGIFAAAHAKDPTVPRLVPIAARTVLGSRPKGKGKRATEPAQVPPMLPEPAQTSSTE